MAMRGNDPFGSWSGSLRGSEHFPSPFLDMASLAMPENVSNAMEWCQYIYYSNSTYRAAMERIVSYFLTPVEVSSSSTQKELGDDEKEKWEDFLTKKIDVLGVVHDLDHDRMCYGNGYASVIVPFKRFLMCPKCKKTLLTLKTVYENPKFKFRFVNYDFHADCNICSYRGPFIVRDEPDNRPETLRVKRWSPLEIKLLHDPGTDEVDYFWQIPEDYKTIVRKGHLFHLERVSKPVLKAIKNNELFRFQKGMLYHMKESTLAGIQNRGLGISRMLVNFRQIWYVQVLHRYNEAIALDYVIPFRVLTPQARSGGQAPMQDPLLSANMGDFMGQVRSMLRMRRRDPAMWHTLPFPVEYKALGGDATQLAPRELLDQGLDTLLNGAGTPVELYKGTLQLQTAPVAMRLFEAHHHHLVHDNNAFLSWLVERVAEILSWEAVSASHMKVSHADDMQKQVAMLQMMMNQSISQTTGLKAVGLDWKDETRLIGEEARHMQEQQARIQEEMDQAAFGQQIAKGQPGGMPQGGMPPGAAPAGAAPAGGVPPGAPGAMPGPVTSLIQNNMMPQTPDEMMQTASQLANDLLGLPESQKDSELRALKAKNEVLHSLVRAEIDKIRGQARSQGGSMLMAQTFGG